MTNKLPNPFMDIDLRKFNAVKDEYFAARMKAKEQPKVPRSRPSGIKRKPKGK